MTETPITDALNAQGILQPGDTGYWKIWGARANDIRSGDLIMVKWSDKPEPSEYEIESRIRGTDLADTIAPKFRAVGGKEFRIGALQSIVVLRKGTRHTLADSI